jgi:hypothetical protein
MAGKRIQKKVVSILTKKGNAISISTYKIQTIEVFQELDAYGDIVMSTIVTMTVIVIMIQIRTMRLSASAKLVDTSESYKLYKNRILKGERGIIFKASLAAAGAFVFLDETKEAVEYRLDEIIRTGLEIYIRSPHALRFQIMPYGLAV